MPSRRELPLDEFVREFFQHVIDYGTRYAFFLGAGCSCSSNIPLAGELVRDLWLPKLMRKKTGRNGDSDAWAASVFEGYTRKTAATFYGPVIEQLFRFPEHRQQEIDSIVRDKQPGFGYGALAKLMTHEKAGPCCNVVLTTNFDDLVADSLYLYGNARPLVIGHEALIHFVRVTRSNPLVVKLHGDHQLAPKNTSVETKELASSVEAALGNLLSESGLVFVGYAGGDASITKALSNLPPTSLRGGVYWVNDTWPDSAFGEWLDRREAIWVRHLDFDELMLMLHVEFDLPNPDDSRFRRLMEEHNQTFERLHRKIFATDVEEATPLKQAAETAAKKFSSARAALMDAYAHEKTEPNKAAALYREALEEFPNDAELLGQFSVFLHRQSTCDEAEVYYKRALEANPKHAINLGNFALFLKNVRGDHDGAERLYRQALDADPKHANTLGNFANFQTDIRGDHDGAERLYQRAIEANPKHANSLGNFAVFLKNVRGDHNGAEHLYQRAVEADPKHAINLGNFALFLTDIRGDHDEAERLYQQALDSDPRHAVNLGNFAVFLNNVRGDHDGAERLYRQALDADPKHANTLGNFANFLTNIRGDHDGAERLYRQAVEADPNNANTLVGYALFLTNIRGDHDGAERLYRQAVEANPKHANSLGNYAGFLFARGKRADGEEQLVQCEGVATDPALLLECRFYRLCHLAWNNDEWETALSAIEREIANGVRSPDFDLSANVARAVNDGHPWPALLDCLAKVIAKRADVAELDRFPEWRAVGQRT